MENIPVELLELFFLQLPSLASIQKCYNTSINWQQIILKLFSNKGIYICEINFYTNLTNIETRGIFKSAIF